MVREKTMRRTWIVLVIISILLAGCRKDAAPVLEDSISKQALLFEQTPTSVGEKGMADTAQPKLAVTATSLPGYPTPLATYLVPAVIINITPIPTTSTPTRVTPTTVATTAVPATPTNSTTFKYIVQPGSPAYLANFSDSAAGCSWQGIGGQVFSAAGVPVTNLVIKAGGSWNGTTSSSLGLGLSGAAPQYGEGGYEVRLGTVAVNSSGTVWIQVFDLASKELSEKIYVNTYADCARNLTLVNFIEKTPGYNIYLPTVANTPTP